MSEPLVDRCKAMRLLMEKMTVAVKAFSLDEFHLHIQKLFAHRTKFRASFAKLYETSPSIQLAAKIWDPSVTPTSDAQDLAAEHLLFISAFSKFITTVLKQLHRPLWEGCSDDDIPFTVLWSMMADVCWVFNLFPRQWPVGHLPGSSPLYPTMQALMVFLLPIACPNVRPWAIPIGRPLHADETRAMITPAASALNNMCASNDASALPALLRSLPPAFLNTLSYIACEGLQAPRANTADATLDFFGQLAKNLATCVVSFVGIPNGEGDIARLRTPAILEVAKRGFLALQEAAINPPPSHSSLHLLRRLLVIQYLGYERQGAPGCAKNIFPDFSAGRARPQTTPAMSPRVTTSETDILRVLFRSHPAELDFPTLESHCNIMLTIIQSWCETEGGRGLSANREPSGNTCSLVLIIEYCSQYVRWWVAGIQEQRRLEEEDGGQGRALSIAFGAKHKSGMEEVQMVFRLACLHASCQKLPDANTLATWQEIIDTLPPSEQPHSQLVRRDLLQLNAWKRSAECVTIMEATMRDAHCPNAANVFITAVDVALRIIVAPRESHDTAALPAMVSLSATIRKLMSLYSRYPLSPSTGAMLAQHGPFPGQQMDLVGSLMISMCTVINVLDATMLTENGDVHAHLRIPGMGDMGLAGPVRSPERTFHMKQMIATLLLCMLQTFAWQVRLEGVRDELGRMHPWLLHVKQHLGELSGDARELAQAVLSQSLEQPVISPAQRSTDLATLYERLAAKSFGGKLLPGCCHLGCTSFEGPSEATLQTQLCGRCRRARYCSVACQTAAWKKGGHRAVCEKGI